MAKRGNPNWKKGGPSPNPRGRKPRTDGWQNALTGIGMTAYDKRLASQHYADIVTPEEALELWRGNDIAARVIETLPNEMLREGWDLCIKGDDVATVPESKREDALTDLEDEGPDYDESTEQADAIVARCEELGVDAALWEALAYRRAYGGAAILLGVNDSQEMTRPLNPDRVRSFDWITALEPRECIPSRWYADPTAPKFGRPALYDILPVSPGAPIDGMQSATFQVHESRLVIFDGIRVSRRATVGITPGWGDSVLTRLRPVLRDYDMSWASASILLHDFAQAVFGIKGLADAMSRDVDDMIKNRLRAVELSRSTARAVLIDAEGETFERKQTPISGLPELLDRFATRLSAAADMPQTLLMGQSPGGLNATGESDTRHFYDRVRAEQSRVLRPAIERIVTLIMRAQGIDEPESWSVEFRPLWTPTAKETAETRYAIAQTDKIYVDAGIVSPEEIAVSRFGGAKFDPETKIDFEARADLEAAGPEPVGKKEPPPPPGFGGAPGSTEDPNESPEPATPEMND